MTSTPTPTGKIRGSLQDVMPKLRNFTGAVKVTTTKGKGGLLLESGRLVASYLTQEGVLHRAQVSLDLLGQESFAEFEILRYDDEQFKEARIICDNRGLLLGEETRAAAGAPAQARGATPREEKQKEEASLLTSMMKRFAAPRLPEKQPVEKQPPAKQEAPRAAPVAEPAKAPLPAVSPSVPPAEATVAGLPVHRPEGKAETAPVAPEQKEAPAMAGETDLSAIIRRLRESPKPEKGTPAPVAKTDAPQKAAPMVAPPVMEGKARPAGTASTAEGRQQAPAEERPLEMSPGGRAAVAPPGAEPEGRVRVDLGQMMKRIKRLDITSIRKELEEGAGSGEPGGKGLPEAAVMATPAGRPSPEPAAAPAPAPEEPGKSDIDELKAFIKKLEVLEEPKEAPPAEKSFLGKLGVRGMAGEEVPPVPRREIPAPVPRKEKLPVEETAREMPLPVVEKPPEKPPVEAPPVEKPVPKPAEPDRKAKITSLLRRSGLVRPPAEEQPKEIIAPPPAEPKVTAPPPAEPKVVVVKEDAAALAEGAGFPVPKLQRKKVEITRVPKMPEKPLREPPLIDEKAIQKVLKQPGVIAVSTFFEGFAVQSAGRADFEQVAANAEDLFRAGKKIAREIDIGTLNQIILETARGKLIIAPIGDLNVCVFTEPDANLGLIRVAIRGMQVEKD
jgi:predicted regulator of Ras-like GTPase activity (Roadblock/LC7/MglB family)